MFLPTRGLPSLFALPGAQGKALLAVAYVAAPRPGTVSCTVFDPT